MWLYSIGLYIWCFLLLGETNGEIYNYVIHDDDAIDAQAFVLWPNGTIPYFIAEGHFDQEQLKAIDEMIKKFELLTCLKFEVTAFAPPENDHVLHFRNPDGVRRCTHSPWGHSVDEPHHVTLGYDCLKSPHLDMMFMKALGFPFEHNRASRDIFIDVQPENVEPMYMEHFAKDPRLGSKMRLLGYDINSAMHFGPYDYSKNGHRTIIFKKKQLQNRVGLSKTDIKKIEMVYGPECKKRGRMQKMDECQSYPTQRKKRSIYSYPRKSLRVNPDITPPPTLSPMDSSELNDRNISDIVREITHHIQIASGLIVKKARIEHCNASRNEIIDNSNDEEVKDVIAKIETHAKSVLERVKSNPEDFCNDENILRTCGLGFQGQKKGCLPGFKSTKFGNVRFSTQHKPTLHFSTQHQSRNDKKRIYLPYPMGREGNVSENSLVTETSFVNVTEVVGQEREVNTTQKRKKRDTLNLIENTDIDADDANDNINEETAPSRRLVKKYRSKATLTPPLTTFRTSKSARTTTTVPTRKSPTTGDPDVNDDDADYVKPKAEEDEYEEVEEIVDDESAITKKPIPKASPARQKRFKKKFGERQSAENREQDTANFDQNQRPKEQNTHKPSPVKKKPHEIPQKVKHKKVVPPKKKEPEIENNESSGEEYTEDEAAGVKNVKVVMEYNTAASSVYATPAQVNPSEQNDILSEKNVEEGDQEQVARQEEESESDSDENQLPEEVQEDDDEGMAVQQQEIVQEEQPDTPSPAFKEQFQEAAVPQKHKKRKPARSEEDEDTGMVIDTTRVPIKPHKITKKQKLIKPSKSVKGLKNRIIDPGTPNQEYQSSVPKSVPRTIKLNKKNLEFYNERKWNDAIVPYVIAEYKQYNTDDLRRRLGEVIKILKRKTCVRLLEVTKQEAEDSYEDYLVLDTSPDYVTGRVGGKQRFGSVELFEGGQHRQHAAMMVMAMLGFYFEVARHDRDRYVRVHLRHVRADKLHHFEKIRDDATFPLPYDYKSATHPAWQFWRKLGKKGISTVATYKESDPSGVLMKSLGQNPELLSEDDITKINTIYGVDCFYKSGLIRDE